jgi:hypothetical protein
MRARAAVIPAPDRKAYVGYKYGCSHPSHGVTIWFVARYEYEQHYVEAHGEPVTSSVVRP